MKKTITVLGRGGFFSDAPSPVVELQFRDRLTMYGERRELYKYDAEALQKMLKDNLPEGTYNRLKNLFLRDIIDQSS